MESRVILRNARMAGGLSLAEVAAKVRVHPSAIGHFEAGRCMPTRQVAARWRQALLDLLSLRNNAITQALGHI